MAFILPEKLREVGFFQTFIRTTIYSTPKEPAIPFGHSTHDYVGGSTLLKKRTIREIKERSRMVDEMLEKYR
jgi:hypothetical protein